MSQAPPVAFIVDDDEAVRDSLGLLLKAAGLTSRAYGSAGPVGWSRGVGRWN